MPNDQIQVLFLCPHNAVRSLMAEAVTCQLGRGRFVAASAGWAPAGAPHPMTLDALRHASIPADGLRSRSWWEFAAPGGPELDAVITLSGELSDGARPRWRGEPVTAVWNFPDPLAAGGSEASRREAFRQLLHGIRKRVELMVNLPYHALERLKLQDSLRRLGTV